MASNPLIKRSLHLLNVSGLNPLNRNKVKTFITAIAVSTMLIEYFLEIIFRWDGLNSMQAIACVIFTQAALHRLVNLIVSRNKFRELIISMESFGSSSNYRELHIKLQTRYSIGAKLMACATGLLFFFTTLFTLIPMVFGMKWISLPMYHYSVVSPYFEIYLIVLFFATTTVVVFLILPSEFLFASLITNIVCELKILKEEIKTITMSSDEKVSSEHILLFIDHHNLILKCVNSLNGIYSGIFLNQFLSTTIGLCACLVAIIAGNDWWYISSIIALFLTCFSKLFIYCMGGTILMAQCEEISVAAYDTMWWVKMHPELCRALVLIIQRSQKVKLLTAAGVIPLNLESFADVLKRTYSIYSVVISIYKN